MREHLSERETATVLAALRCYQQELERPTVRIDVADIASDGGTVAPLTAEDIDGLCERLNCGGMNPTEVRNLILTGDWEILAILALPEDAMSEEAMRSVHAAASDCFQQIRNLTPEELPSLEAVERRIRHMALVGVEGAVESQRGESP